MLVNTAEFVTSVAIPEKLGQFDMPQFAFVGRSNVGKSSLLNALACRNKLAKTSGTPGRTRLVNIFEINKSFYLVDLPGYGFAKASKEEQAGWQQLIGAFLENSTNLKMVFVLVDCRHQPSPKDVQMLDYLYRFQIPFKLVATKIDKLSRSELNRNKTLLASTLSVGVDDILFVSAKDKKNIDKIWEVIEQYL